jgi:hypothetical protein
LRWRAALPGSWNSVLQQKVVFDLKRRIPHGEFFTKPVPLESHDKPVSIVSAEQIAGTGVRVLKPEAYRNLTVIPKERS